MKYIIVPNNVYEYIFPIFVHPITITFDSRPPDPGKVMDIQYFKIEYDFELKKFHLFTGENGQKIQVIREDDYKNLIFLSLRP